MLYVRIIISIALLLMAAFGPGIGLRPATSPTVDKAHAGHDHVDRRRTTVLILRILAAMLGLWLLFFSVAQLLHGHRHLPPPTAQSLR
ncbi:MAG TPA: hypothetical protein VH139_08385 [Acidobacteriaceae bacterium]|nr:hypothetical protein [Acidobacteriaceae bacterium]